MFIKSGIRQTLAPEDRRCQKRNIFISSLKAESGKHSSQKIVDVEKGISWSKSEMKITSVLVIAGVVVDDVISLHFQVVTTSRLGVLQSLVGLKVGNAG